VEDEVDEGIALSLALEVGFRFFGLSALQVLILFSEVFFLGGLKKVGVD